MERGNFDMRKWLRKSSCDMLNISGCFDFFRLETENGISISQVGKLKDEKTFVVSGSYSYTGADGKRYRVRYTADEKGFHPKTELEEFDFDE